MAGGKITLYQTDNLVKLYINITKDSLVESIIGAEVEFVMEGATTENKIIKSTHALDLKDKIEITDAEMGEICVTLYRKDTEVVDTYNARITTTYSNGTRLTNDALTSDGEKAKFQIKEPKVDFETQ